MIFEKAAKFEIVVCCRKIGGVLRVNYVYEWGGGGGFFRQTCRCNFLLETVVIIIGPIFALHVLIIICSG